jgi:hypothetical protein
MSGLTRHRRFRLVLAHVRDLARSEPS